MVNDPTDKLIAQGKLAVQEGNVQRALAIFTTVLESDPYRAEVFLLRGAAFLRHNEIKKALKDLDRAIQLGGEGFVIAYQQRSAIHKLLGNQEAYQADLRHFVTKKATYAAKNNQLDSAIDLYGQLIASIPEDTDAHHARAVLYFNQGNYAAALDDYNTILRLNPRDAEAYSNRSAIQMILNKTALALVDINLALQFKPDAVAFRHRSQIHLTLGKYKEALTDAQEAMKLDGRNPESYRARAEVLYHIDKPLAALNDIRQYEALGGNRAYFKEILSELQNNLYIQVDGETAKKVEQLIAEAKQWDDDNQLQKAQRTIENALKLAPKYAPLYVYLGDYYRFQEEFEDAYNAYNAALKLNSDLENAYYGRALTHLNRKKRDPQAAIADLDQALTFSPEYSMYYRVRGMAYSYSTHPDDRQSAVADLKRYLELGGGVEYGDALQINKLVGELRQSLS